LPDDFTVERIRAAQALLARTGASRFDKRDVSDEPRVPAGQPGGGEWEAEDEDGDADETSPDPLLIPAQAVPLPLPIPFDLPSTQPNANVNVPNDGQPITGPSLPQTANIDRQQICNERCSPLLERWKPYRSSDVNQYAYYRCVAECLNEPS
jgi:hypothetical protein